VKWIPALLRRARESLCQEWALSEAVTVAKPPTKSQRCSTRRSRFIRSDRLARLTTGRAAIHKGSRFYQNWLVPNAGTGQFAFERQARRRMLGASGPPFIHSLSTTRQYAPGKIPCPLLEFRVRLEFEAIQAGQDSQVTIEGFVGQAQGVAPRRSSRRGWSASPIVLSAASLVAT